MQLTWQMTVCSKSCKLFSQRFRNHADQRQGLAFCRLLRYKQNLTLFGACRSQSQSSSAWWIVQLLRIKFPCSFRNSHQVDMNVGQLKCLILVTRDRTITSHTVSVTDCLHVHHFAKSLKPFFGEVLCTHVCNIGNTWFMFQRDLFLVH